MAKTESKLELINHVHRPEVGSEIPILVFRAFRHFTADYVTKMLGKGAMLVFQNAGRDLGREAGEMLKKPTLEEYLAAVTKFVRDTKMGILKAHEIREERMVLGLDECITCAGMPNIGKRICHFEVGFVAGVVEVFAGVKVRAFETKCNANGEGICEVTVDLTQRSYDVKTSGQR